MKTHEPLSLFRLIKQIMHSGFSLASDLLTLARLESKLAKQSLTRIIALLFLAAILLFSTWFYFLVFLVIYLVSLHINLLISLSLITLLNIVLLFIVCIYISKLRANLFFPVTRRQLKIASSSKTGAPK